MGNLTRYLARELEGFANDRLRINWSDPARTTRASPRAMVVAWSLIGVHRFRGRIIESVLDFAGRRKPDEQ